MTKKFKVVAAGREEWDGELAVIKVTNRAGRSWVSKTPKEAYLVSEEIDALAPYLEDGGKLVAAEWEEVTA